jgi:type I restriction enzyme S subunit
MKIELSPYPTYEQTKSEWIGDVPTGWDVLPFKRICKRVDVGIAEAATHAYAETGVPIVRGTNVRPNKIEGEILFIEPWFAEKNHSKYMRAGDLVTVRTGYPGVTAVIPDELDNSQCFTLIISTLKEGHLPKFYSYFFNSTCGMAHFAVQGWGSAQTNISVPTVQEILVPFPPTDQQEAIVSFLDHETAKIERVVEVRQKQVDLLQEQRCAVIHHAVTKGLDPQASLVLTGLPWARHMPAQWKKKRLKFLGQIVLGKMMTNNDAGEMKLRPYLKARNVQWDLVDVSDIDEMWFAPSEMKKLGLARGDLVVTEGGEVGRAAMWRGELEECYLQNSVHKVTFRKPNEPEYFLYQFYAAGHAGHFDAIVNRISIAHLTRDKLADVTFLVPLPDEQRSIASYIEREIAKLDAVISQYHRELELLDEYRASLISHAVTGKIDVRGLVDSTRPEAVGAL